MVLYIAFLPTSLALYSVHLSWIIRVDRMALMPIQNLNEKHTFLTVI
jgi:hypothetical protein